MKDKKIRTSVVIAAGGCGSRMKTCTPKQFLHLGGKPIIQHTLEVFENCPGVDELIIVCPIQDIRRVNEIVSAAGISKVSAVVKGGESRQESVKNGIDAAYGDIILIHDAVRPFVTEEQIQCVIKAAEKYDAAALCRPITDTVKRLDNDCITKTLDRTQLGAVQTPQGFRAELIRKAHKAALERGFSATDDCALCEMLGVEIHAVLGDNLNIKITMPEDLILAEGILHSKNARITGAADAYIRSLPRTGFGYDVHRLVDGRPLILGGVTVPYSLGLLGHSDADVLLHAVADAILGAAALGDIGTHFPDTDEKWKDADSRVLLAAVGKLVREKGYSIVSIDSSITAQKPKLMPYIPDMQKNISEALGISRDMVSVKATTTEKLGFCGRGEGIAANAVCTIIRN